METDPFQAPPFPCVCVCVCMYVRSLPLCRRPSATGSRSGMGTVGGQTKFIYRIKKVSFRITTNINQEQQLLWQYKTPLLLIHSR